MIRDVPIVLLHAEQPTAEHRVVDVKPLDKVQVEEHPETRGECVVVCHVLVVELEVVQLKMRRRRDSQGLSGTEGRERARALERRKRQSCVDGKLKKESQACTNPQSLRVFQRRRRMVTQYLQRDALLRHRYHSLFVPEQQTYANR